MFPSSTVVSLYRIHHHPLFVQLTYEIPDNQLQFLKLMTETASQQLTVLCSRVSLVNEQQLRLFSDNDKEFTDHGPLLRFSVLEDGCRVSVREGRGLVRPVFSL